MRRIVTITGLMTLLLALAAAPALAQDYPPEGPTAAVSETVVVPGEAITITSDGWLANSEVTITFESEPQVLDTVQTGDDGAFTTQVTIPADASPGEHTLRLTGLDPDGQARTVAIALTVPETAGVGAGVTPGTGLPATGSNTALALFAAFGLLGVGGGAVYAARRRERAHTAG